MLCADVNAQAPLHSYSRRITAAMVEMHVGNMKRGGWKYNEGVEMKQSLDTPSGLEWKQGSFNACGISLQSDDKHQVYVIIMFDACSLLPEFSRESGENRY